MTGKNWKTIYVEDGIYPLGQKVKRKIKKETKPIEN